MKRVRPDGTITNWWKSSVPTERGISTPMTTTYKITRFYQDGPESEGFDSETIATGLTLDEAQAHCRRDDTHGDGWFDGYEKEV